MLWNLADEEVRVAAFNIGEAPYLLLANQRPNPSCLPIYEVNDLEESVQKLKGRGRKAHRRPLEIPNGPCYTFLDPNCNEIAIFQDDRPHVMTLFAEKSKE